METYRVQDRTAVIFIHQTRACGLMQTSCGLLMYVRAPLRVLLVHPGGPYWRNKDLGAWSIPKGLSDAGEDPLAAAQREFTEETGLTARPPFLELTPLKQRSGKLVRCWAFEGVKAPVMIGKSMFEMEWPPHSGQMKTFPEVDDARLFEVDESLTRILPGQAPFIDQLAVRLEGR